MDDGRAPLNPLPRALCAKGASRLRPETARMRSIRSLKESISGGRFRKTLEAGVWEAAGTELPIVSGQAIIAYFSRPSQHEPRAGTF